MVCIFRRARLKKIVVHIGANKTASTTLQRCLFSQHAGLDYLGHDGQGFEEYGDLVTSLTADDDLYFPRERCGELFGSYKERNAQKTLLYSDEDIMTSQIPMMCARRLYEFFPEAEILVVVRNQMTAIPSYYANHGVHLRPAPPSHFRRYVSFDDWMNFCHMFLSRSPLAGFFYDRILCLYAELFGKEKIHVLFFEEFVKDKRSFVDKLCQTLNIDLESAMDLLSGAHERKRRSEREIKYLRFRNIFFWDIPVLKRVPGGDWLAERIQTFLESGPPANVLLSDHWKKKIIEMYSEDNKRFAQNFGVDLKEHNYPMN